MALTAWLFPGQGSQFPSMGRSLQQAEIFTQAEERSGLPLRAVMTHGPSTLLRRPDFLEPCITALQIAAVDLLHTNGMAPDVVAGYSLGEIGALYAAGCFTAGDALMLAVERGRVLTGFTANGKWSSASVSFEKPPAAVPVQTAEGVYTACFNSVRDFTITGEAAAVMAAETRLAKAGAAVSQVETDGPWHSPLAAEASAACAELVKSVSISAPAMPVCLGSSGRFETNADALREAFSRTIAAPVLWSAALDALWEADVRTTLEIAPGHTLTGFLRNQWRGRQYQARFMEREGGRAFQIVEKPKDSLCNL